MPDVLFFMILGHFFGDYALQSDRMAERKVHSLLVLSIHVLIYTICIGAFWAVGLMLNGQQDAFSLFALVALVAIYLLHWLQDFFKYGISEVKAQIKASEELGFAEWLLWDPALTYTVGALRTEGS